MASSRLPSFLRSLSLIWVAAVVGTCTSLSAAATGDAARLRGPYLGQDPPGMTARLFAPGFVSTGEKEIMLVVPPDGREIYATRILPGRGPAVMVWRQSLDGTWSAAEIAPFSGRWADIAVSFSPDGRRLWLVSDRPITPGGDPVKMQDIWYVERAAEGKWSEPLRPGAPINSEGRDLTPCDAGKALYFNRTPVEGENKMAILRAPREGASFGEPENLSAKIPLGFFSFEPAVPEDERFMIFAGSGGPGDRGGFDLYVTFRSCSGAWSPPRNLGSGVNTPANEHFPTLSPDGRFLFFVSDRDEKGAAVEADGSENPDIYWVSTEIIEGLRAGG